jgi:hypothetical protein
VAVVELPLGDENRQDWADEGDNDSVDDEPAAQQQEYKILLGASLGREGLPFRGHHGILQEVGSSRNGAWRKFEPQRLQQNSIGLATGWQQNLDLRMIGDICND